MYKLELLLYYGKMVKTKSQKILGLIPAFVEVTEEKLKGWCLFGPPILDRVKAINKNIKRKEKVCIQ